MIRVLHTIGTLEIGGEQRYLARLTRSLDPTRFRQVVVFTDAEHMLPEFAPGVRFVKLHERRLTAKQPQAMMLVPRFVRLIRAHRADLVTTHGAGIFSLAASAAAKLLGKPVVHTIQRPFANRSRTEDVTARVPGLRHAIYALTDRFVALGTYYARDQRERWKIPSDKIHLSYIGIELDRFRPDPALGADARRELGIDPEAPVLGVVARHEPVKGIPRGVEAFAAVRSRLANARLLLVGDGRARAEIETRARDLCVRDSVVFAGARTDTARMMNACDVVMQTTYNPLNGISSIEGMAVGKPIVTVVDHPEEEKMAADTCDERENGLFFRTLEREASADRLAALLVDRERLARLGNASRRIAEERFRLEAHAADVAALYDSLARPPRSRAWVSSPREARA